MVYQFIPSRGGAPAVWAAPPPSLDCCTAAECGRCIKSCICCPCEESEDFLSCLSSSGMICSYVMGSGCAISQAFLTSVSLGSDSLALYAGITSLFFNTIIVANSFYNVKALSTPRVDKGGYKCCLCFSITCLASSIISFGVVGVTALVKG